MQVIIDETRRLPLPSHLQGADITDYEVLQHFKDLTRWNIKTIDVYDGYNHIRRIRA